MSEPTTVTVKCPFCTLFEHSIKLSPNEETAVIEEAHRDCKAEVAKHILDAHPHRIYDIIVAVMAIPGLVSGLVDMSRRSGRAWTAAQEGMRELARPV